MVLKTIFILAISLLLAGLAFAFTARALFKEKSHQAAAKTLLFISISMLSIAMGLCIAGTIITAGI